VHGRSCDLRNWPKAADLSDATVVRSLGYTGRAANVVGRAVLDPDRTSIDGPNCKLKATTIRRPSAIYTLQLTPYNPDSTPGILAPAAEAREHVEHDVISNRRRCLLPDGA
jgi:hypothetical protein